MKKSRHAVGECYKTLNTHDPHEMYACRKSTRLGLGTASTRRAWFMFTA
jgi:hypothetical protein